LRAYHDATSTARQSGKSLSAAEIVSEAIDIYHCLLLFFFPQVYISAIICHLLFLLSLSLIFHRRFLLPFFFLLFVD